jgi:hypothetical protein
MEEIYMYMYPKILEKINREGIKISTSHSWQGVLDTTLCDKVCQWLSPVTLVSSTNKTDHHDLTEILLNLLQPHFSVNTVE